LAYVLTRNAGTRHHGYVSDFDVEPDSDGPIVIDARQVVGLHPLCAVRLQLFIDRQRTNGRVVDLREPTDPETKRVFGAFGIGSPLPGYEDAVVNEDSDVILRPARLTELTQVDELADALLLPLIDHFDDVAVVRDAVLMAFSELCQNAAEHGASPAGCVVAASRGDLGSPKKAMLGIGDLGLGIPAHIRKTHPELVVDEHAIGRALEEGVTGTQRGDRGFGFSWVLKETLASAATAAEMFIRAGSGAFRREITDNRCKDHGWNAGPTRGTWIAHDWTTVAADVRSLA
jgi:hypothetical protein